MVSCGVVSLVTSKERSPTSGTCAILNSLIGRTLTEQDTLRDVGRDENVEYPFVELLDSVVSAHEQDVSLG